jgi:hypothetical protein
MAKARLLQMLVVTEPWPDREKSPPAQDNEKCGSAGFCILQQRGRQHPCLSEDQDNVLPAAASRCLKKKWYTFPNSVMIHK